MMTTRSRSKVEGRRSKVGRRRAAIYRFEGVAAKPLVCAGGLPVDEGVSRRRAVWLDVTAPKSRGLDSNKHRRRLQEKTQPGIRSFPEYRRGFPGRNGVFTASQQRFGALGTSVQASPRRLRPHNAHAAHPAGQGRSRQLPVRLHLRPSTFDIRPTGASAVPDLS